MRRADFVDGKKMPKNGVPPFVVLAEGSPDKWELAVVYDIGPSSFFESDRYNTILNMLFMSGYPASYGSWKNFYDHPFIEKPEFKDKVEEMYEEAKKKCRTLGYRTDLMP